MSLLRFDWPFAGKLQPIAEKKTEKTEKLRQPPLHCSGGGGG